MTSWGENEVLHMKWRVLQITAFKRLNHLSNRNEQVLKMNFKLLLKWIFVRNQFYRFSKDEQLLCSKFFELPHKNGRKIWFPKRIRYFQMHSSFNFYLSNQCSNEKVPKTKVVDIEILNNFGIQEFFIWGREEGEKTEFTYPIAIGLPNDGDCVPLVTLPMVAPMWSFIS